MENSKIYKETEIKEVESSHLQELFNLLNGDFHTEETDEPLELNYRQYKNFIKKHYGKLYVAVYKEKVIGTIQITILGNPFDNTIGYITDFIVHKDFRRNGIGTKLFNAAYEYALSQGVSSIELASKNCKERQAAYKFYEENSFENKECKHFTLDVDPLSLALRRIEKM